MEKLENILKKYDFTERTAPSLSKIKEIESIVGFSLPADYNFYLQKYHGFEESIGQEYVRLWDLDDIIQFNKDYQVVEFLPNTIGIGGNGGGELIAIENLSDGNYRIVLTPLIDLDSEYHIVIGSSFTDFLVRFDSGEEWFR